MGKEICCCCTLRTASQIIGWLQLVLSAIIIVSIGEMTGRVNDQLILIVLIGFTILHLGFALCLLIGVAKESTGLLLAWFIYNLVGSIISFIANIILVRLLMGIISACIQYCTLLTVCSYYYEIKSRPDSAVVYVTNESIEPKPKDTNDIV